MKVNLVFKVFVCLLYCCSGWTEENDFLNTEDDSEYSYVNSTGNEKGFYFQITSFYNEDVFPKRSLLPELNSNLELEKEILKNLLLIEPILIFSRNTAECHLFQGPFYSINDLVAKGSLITFAYLVKVNSKIKNKSCNLKILSADSKLILKEIDYFTTSED